MWIRATTPVADVEDHPQQSAANALYSRRTPVLDFHRGLAVERREPVAKPVFRGGAGLLVRPDGDAHQILAVDLTVRPQGPHRTVILPLPVGAERADGVEWLPIADHALFTHLDGLFHPLVQEDGGEEVGPDVNAASLRMPPRATVEGGVVVGREGLLQAGLTGNTGEVPVDAVCVWAKITPPARPLLVRWLGLNWGWPKAALAVRMPRPEARRLVLPTRGLAGWPSAFRPPPTLYVQAPRNPGPVWVDPQQAPGHPFDWRPQERPGLRPSPLEPEWPIFRAFCTDRAASHDVVVELLDRGARHADASMS